MFFFFWSVKRKLPPRRRMENEETSDEISHHCFLYMMQNLDGNKADIFYMSVTTDLIMRFVPKPLSVARSPDMNPEPEYVASYKSLSKSTQQYFPCILGHACGTWKQWAWIIQRLNPLQVQRGGQYSALSRSSKQDSRCWKLEQSLVTYTLNFNCFFSQPLPSHLWSSSSWNVKSVMPARFSWLCLCRIKDICVTVEGEKNTLWCWR